MNAAPAPGAQNPSARLRELCLALQDAMEKPMKRGPTYRIADKIFAMDRLFEGRPSLWCKAPAGSQAVLLGADPERFFIPPYVGAKGWIGVRLDKDPDWSEVAALVRRSYDLIRPTRRSASKR